MSKQSGPRVKAGYVDTIVLGLLAREPMYGYQICREIECLTEGRMEFKDGTLYPSLRRMEKAGLIEGYWEEPEVCGRPRRRYYRLTKAGREAFRERTAEWREFRRLLDRLLGEQPCFV
ncbi:MAG: helix-turn-helix transcriptional regulator [Thermoanaerobacterales bacterium]|nr:helix-turn-helix transcriptional regulator [Bacillota bacterium]MDI6907000.1 helix-turn-helix transcriptional regulator [Thermoanaerobacterales bacterium]